ncbi:MAG: serine hydrolase domain-containing protein [Bryobacteraceae bacterium]|nr:serine hydrolase domain-containing protein [Bryobacteraceae bacterium]
MMKVWILLLALLATASAQKFDAAALEKVAKEEMENDRVPGAAIAVIQEGKVIYVNGLGVANIETGQPINKDMLFRLGSTTKMFTAAAVVSLAMEGKLSLDEPVGKYIPGLAPRVAAVTAHQILTHTAGIRDEAPMYGPDDEEALGKGILAWKEDYLFTAPGKVMSYSNPGYWLAGYLAEVAGGKRYADVVDERIFKPAGMTRTTFRPLVAMTYPLAQGHDTRGGATVIARPAANHAGTFPSGSIYSNVEDLARFAMAFMNEGRLDGKQVLPASLPGMMLKRGVSIPGGHNKYAYGLMDEDFRGVRLAQHGGARLGYGSTLRMAPAHRAAVIILGNRNGADLGRTATAALEMLLPLKPRGSDELKPAVPVPEKDFPLYVGEYAHGARKVAIAVENGKLVIKLGSRTAPLTLHEDDRMSFTPPGASRADRMNLVRGEGGRVEYLTTSLRAMARL